MQIMQLPCENAILHVTRMQNRELRTGSLELESLMVEVLLKP